MRRFATGAMLQWVGSSGCAEVMDKDLSVPDTRSARQRDIDRAIRKTAAMKR